MCCQADIISLSRQEDFCRDNRTYIFWKLQLCHNKNIIDGPNGIFKVFVIDPDNDI